jgi:hypothetical protein
MGGEMVPPTTERVARQTGEDSNGRIRRQTEANVAYFAQGNKRLIGRRLRELDREWDIERLLEVNAASASLVGLLLARFVTRGWFLLPAAVAAFLLQHAIHGWCPPIPVFRRLGIRTQTEIDHERYALKALRGDFKKIQGDGRDKPVEALEAARS